jgi:TolB-like protein/Tfp pilus assembly protein PilF
MSSIQEPHLHLEVGHILFLDIVGYSKLLADEQKALVQELNQIVRETEQFRTAEAEGKLTRLPTGDGMVLVFTNNPEAPVECALEISKALQSHPKLRVRMGIHSGPVNPVADVNDQSNLLGAGINVAQRVMYCGDAGHILLSKHFAEDLEHYAHWRSHLHDVGEATDKHGLRMRLVSLYTDRLGNSALPTKLRRARAAFRVKSAVFAALLLIAALSIGFWILRRPQEKLMNVAAVIPHKSIAVLPFENLSEDKANAYFADGIQDEILTRLSKIADLKVISRTSTQHYKSAPEHLTEIAKELGVAHILEGRVQKSGDIVRVNVQLIKAANDSHLWADTFDRKLTDIFSVESEIASAIAEQLNAKLTGAEQKALALKPTNNVAAYDAYLRGRSVEGSGFGRQPAAAAADYAEAVRLDPKFALAWARLAVQRGLLYFHGVDPRTNSPAAVREAADQALTLQPESGEAWIAQGVYRYRVLRDFSGALQAYENARERLPNSADVFAQMAHVEARLGRWEAAETHYKTAAELDPRNLAILLPMSGEFLDGLRRFTEAHAVVDRALQIAPRDESALAVKASLFHEEGQLDAAAKELARVPMDSQNEAVRYTRAFQLMYERHFEAAIAQMQFLTAAFKSGEPLDGNAMFALVVLGYCQERAGRTDEARATFARVTQAPKTGDFYEALQRARAYAGLGDKEKALEQARLALMDLGNDAKSKPTAETVLAQVQARFGDLDSAFAALPHLLEVPFGITRGLLRIDPMWDPLRKDPRFQKLCEEKQP